MASRGRPSISKRQKEQARRERQKRKEERLAERRAGRIDGEAHPLDISDIVAGPQPIPTDEDE